MTSFHRGDELGEVAEAGHPGRRLQEAMQKAEAAGDKERPVKIKLVAPPSYGLNTRTLDKHLGYWLRLRIEKAVTKVLAKFNSCRNATGQSSHLCSGVGKAVDQVRDIFNNWWNATEQSSPHISQLPV
ncbi:hypothetical protein F0562_014040 [Nyssa sinensis]|uniref:Uncharacterized protein n=1 Tax=Nyssa sinensis TaxID=561372 RepID=A0A5J4ZMP8_9ASTE|nr:hypothetical protein F0562_014040 [Nyssa sinensis]